ncbi:Ankyrin repeat-containing protein [Cladophialophora immunda]|nr:Ankyrin repeat-containing protein [Cladophialophora immunda]
MHGEPAGFGENLLRIENIIYLHLASMTHRNTSIASGKNHSPPAAQPCLPTNGFRGQNRKWRTSLFEANSFLRTLGLYGRFVNDERREDARIETVICFGLCFPVWLMLASIAFELSFCNAPCSGKTPLLIAIRGQHLDAVEYPLQNGADPNLADDDQVTPLFAAAGMDLQRNKYFEQPPPTWGLWLETVRMLIKDGASVSDVVRGRTLASLNVTEANESCTTLEYLQLPAAEDSIQLDTMVGHECWSALQNALQSNAHTVGYLQMLKSTRVDLTKVMDDGRTALHLASDWCVDSEPHQYLCTTDCRRFINSQDHWGWTPLHHALIARNSAESHAPYSKAIMLIQNGAMMNIEGGNNPRNHYPQPQGKFTALQLLRFARPFRCDMFLDSCASANIRIDPEMAEDRFHDCDEYLFPTILVRVCLD